MTVPAVTLGDGRKPSPGMLPTQVSVVRHQPQRFVGMTRPARHSRLIRTTALSQALTLFVKVQIERQDIHHGFAY